MALPSDVLGILTGFAKKGVRLWGPHFREHNEVRRANDFWREVGCPEDVDIYVSDGELQHERVNLLADDPPFQGGDRIELDAMGEDPDPIPAGTRGTVTNCVKLDFGPPRCWQVWVQWDIDRHLSLCIPPDKAHKIHS